MCEKMSTILEKANAKINLGLDILGKREDGYHEVSMIMQSIGLCDVVTIDEGKGIEVTTNLSGLSCGPDNLAYKAALLLAEKFKIEPQVHIHLEKKIFMAAGLAGGSSDAAAVLRGLNRYWELNLTNEELRTLAAQLGSDIPFCIEGGTALAVGRGEIIKPLEDMPETIVVLAKPRNIEVSTAWVYKNYNKGRVVCAPKIYLIKEHICEGGHAIVSYFGNVLETVTIPEYPVLAAIKARMLGAGAYYAMMSGSGPTIYAFADSQEIAQRIIEALEDFDVETAVTTTIRRGQ